MMYLHLKYSKEISPTLLLGKLGLHKEASSDILTFLLLENNLK